MVISMKEMYVGETAEIISVNREAAELRLIKDIGLREGKLIDLIHCDPIGSKKIVIKVDNSSIAFDIGIAANIKVRPLKTYYEVARNQANYDKLTGCLNRYSAECILMGEFAKFTSNRIPLSVLMADIDYFKRINDTYGHAAGDSVLKAISTLFKQSLRRCDCLCRWGGEEFLILLRGALLSEAGQTAERLRQSVESHMFNPFRGSGFATISIGACGIPPEKDIDRLIETADAALYNAKRNGRNCISLCEV